VGLIAAVGGAVSAQAAKAATSTIAIVFVSGGDPVQHGLVASLSRPGGNVTGVSLITAALGGKRLELLSELLPSVRVVAMLINPKNPDAEFEAKDIQTAARALGREIRVLKVTTEADFEPVFATLVQQRVGALIVGADPFVNRR